MRDDLILDNDSQLKSNKSYTAAVCLSGIFGILGIQHFYLGRIGLGIFDLGLSIAGFTLLMVGYPVIGIILLGIDFIHTIIVTFQLLVGQFKDGEGKIVAYPGQKLN